MPYQIALTYNLKRKSVDPSAPADLCSEFDSEKTVQAIVDVLESAGHRVTRVEATPDAAQLFRAHRDFDLVFNIAEGSQGTAREAQIPALLDLVGIPYTGSGVTTMAVALDKALTKKVLQYEGVPTPAFQVFSRPEEGLDPRLSFPLIVKPNREGSAKGISADSVVRDEARLREQLAWVHGRYAQEALVEEFIEGMELTVGILGDREPRVLPAMEIDFSTCKPSGETFYSWRMKEFQGDSDQFLTPVFYCPARLSKEARTRVEEAALAAHRALGCRDVSRVDIRLDREGVPYVLEVNPLPGLDPRESNLPLIARSAGLDYPKLILGIVESAMKRALSSKEATQVERS